MSPLPGSRKHCDPIRHVSSCSSEVCCKLLYSIYLTFTFSFTFMWSDVWVRYPRQFRNCRDGFAHSCTSHPFAQHTESLKADLLELLVSAQEIFQEEIAPLGLEVNWQKNNGSSTALCHGQAFKSSHL